MTCPLPARPLKFFFRFRRRKGFVSCTPQRCPCECAKVRFMLVTLPWSATCFSSTARDGDGRSRSSRGRIRGMLVVFHSLERNPEESGSVCVVETSPPSRELRRQGLRDMLKANRAGPFFADIAADRNVDSGGSGPA